MSLLIYSVFETEVKFSRVSKIQQSRPSTTEIQKRPGQTIQFSEKILSG